MTIVGEASLDVRPETSNFESELQAQINAALPQVEVPVSAMTEEAVSEIEGIGADEINVPVDAAVEEAQEEINSLSGGEIEIPIAADTSEIEGVVDEAIPTDVTVQITPEMTGSVNPQEGGFEQAGKDAGSAFSEATETAAMGRLAGFGTKVSGVLAGGMLLKGAFDELVEAEGVTAQVEARIKSTGGVANVTAQEIDDLASSISRKTGIDDEQIASGAALMMTFKNVRDEVGEGNDIFSRATQTAADMSVTFGQDLSGSVVQLSKALDDPIRGVTALRRVGVSFTEQQQEQIRTLVESGNTLAAQKLILAELETQVGGTSEAVGDTLGGSWDKMSNSLAEAGGNILGMVDGPLKGLLGGVTDAADGVSAFVENLTGADIDTAKGKIAGLGEELEHGRISVEGFFEQTDQILRETPGAFDALTAELERLGLEGEEGAERVDELNAAFERLSGAGARVRNIGFDVHDAGLTIAGFATTTRGAGRDVVRFAGMTGKELRDWREEVGASLLGATEDFVDMGENGRLSFRELMKGAREQYRNVEEFADNMKDLRRKDASDGLIKWLTESGDVGIQAAAVLARSSKREIEAFERTRGAAKETSQDIAASFGKTGSAAKGAEDRVGNLSSSVRAMPKGVEVTFTAPGLAESQRSADALLSTLRSLERGFAALDIPSRSPNSTTTFTPHEDADDRGAGTRPGRPVETGATRRERIEASQPTPVKVTNAGLSPDSRNYRQRIYGVNA